MKGLATLVAIVVGLLLISTVKDFPSWGDPNSPANANVSSYYLEYSVEDTHVPNVVTTTLADYRSFDTMFETAVVCVAFLGVFAILRRKKESGEATPPHNSPDSLILKNAVEIMVPMMQLFGLYVIAHGHYSPGGGFQGGVILGASLIVLGMARNVKDVFKSLSESKIMLYSLIGVLIFSGVGLGCLLLGRDFLNYRSLSAILPGVDDVMARYYAMLAVEIGVGFTVMCGMLAIYMYLATDGTCEEAL